MLRIMFKENFLEHYQLYYTLLKETKCYFGRIELKIKSV